VTELFVVLDVELDGDVELLELDELLELFYTGLVGVEFGVFSPSGVIGVIIGVIIGVLPSTVAGSNSGCPTPFSTHVVILNVPLNMLVATPTT